MNRLIPLVPLLLIALPVQAAQFTLRWTDNSSGTGQEEGFIVERCPTLTPGAATVWEPVGSVGTDVTVFVDDLLPLNASFSYRVYAWNVRGQSGYSNVVGGTTSSIPQTLVIPNRPTGLGVEGEKPFRPPTIPST